VQLYVRDEVASVTRPVKLLKAFERVTLEAGELRTLRFVLPSSAFAIWDEQMHEVVEPGVIGIMAGPDSENLRSVEIELVAT
jgi:beta-glucosidase